MSDKKYEKIDKFIDLFNDFKSIRQQQKMRGLNDFNIFTTLRGGTNDEVRLHSRFLTFLLSPDKSHNQGNLFLDLFLKEIGLSAYFNDTNECRTYAEYQNIDIYITDGNKHIIIENKIWAGDQHAQIKRYIEIINKENKDLDNENLKVIYLSVDRGEPSRYSLCHNQAENESNTKENCPDGFYIKNKKIIGRGKNEGKYQFINLNYNNQIKEWLEKSHQQIANITNLSVVINQYQEVIQKLYGTYKEKIMDLNEYLEDKTNKTELIKTMNDISKEFKKYRESAISDFFTDAQDKLQKQVGDGWEVVFSKERLNGKTYQLPFYVSNKKSDNAISLMFDFDAKNYSKSYFSIKRIDGEKHKFKDDFFNNIGRSELLKRNTAYSIAWDYYGDRGDIFEKIIDDENKAVDNFVDEFMKLFKNYEGLIIKCNEKILGTKQ